jgi:hypothetical protein
MYLAAGGVLLVVLLLFWLLVIAPTPPPAGQEEMPGGLVLWDFLRAYMPWILLLAVLLEAVEAFVVLRRFRRAEAERQADAQPPYSRGS